jgi:hypothetical protein
MWPDLLTHRELTSLTAKREGEDRRQPREPFVAAWGHRENPIVLALTQFIHLTFVTE